MPKRATATEGAICRALRAAIKAGTPPTGLTVSPDGAITLHLAASAPPVAELSPLDQWVATHGDDPP